MLLLLLVLLAAVGCVEVVVVVESKGHGTPLESQAAHAKEMGEAVAAAVPARAQLKGALEERCAGLDRHRLLCCCW